MLLFSNAPFATIDSWSGRTPSAAAAVARKKATAIVLVTAKPIVVPKTCCSATGVTRTMCSLRESSTPSLPSRLVSPAALPKMLAVMRKLVMPSAGRTGKTRDSSPVDQARERATSECE